MSVLEDAARFALAHETPWPRDLRAHLEAGFFEPPPHNEILGPIRPRGGPNGLILRSGSVLARWGDTQQVDFTFSVAKSYLEPAGRHCGQRRADQGAGRAGCAYGHRRRVRGITQRRHHLAAPAAADVGVGRDAVRQVRCHRSQSEPRRRREGAEGRCAAAASASHLLGIQRRAGEPAGTGAAAPVSPTSAGVFAERIMRPIGASDTWSWHGYRTSMVEIDGRPMESVSGGSHWGGGIAIHAEDQARAGSLMLHRGVWNGRLLLPEGWTEESLKPCALHPDYGLLWWLNTGRTRYPSASEASFFASGAGGNITWIDPEHDLVAVMRWLDPASVDGFIRLVMSML